ncbi:hypothetical protein ANANG_G00270020 [Anguilla anguilla]|uniref:Uncharacterized protein n=1 Tax=Anguilla anguilla TaxID=7936 RepID=A0A9D3LU49_ANGAN|nr:hypothetical protein ANANG_G00270020 [Anguilla anguilla]
MISTTLLSRTLRWRCLAPGRRSPWCTGSSSGWRTAPCTSTSPPAGRSKCTRPRPHRSRARPRPARAHAPAAHLHHGRPDRPAAADPALHPGGVHAPALVQAPPRAAEERQHRGHARDPLHPVRAAGPAGARQLPGPRLPQHGSVIGMPIRETPILDDYDYDGDEDDARPGDPEARAGGLPQRGGRLQPAHARRGQPGPGRRAPGLQPEQEG